MSSSERPSATTWKSESGLGPSGTRGSTLAMPTRRTQKRIQGGQHEEESTYSRSHPQPSTARVSSDRQDVDLSVSAQLRALKEYARANGYSVAREYVDEAESGRVADRPQFREMIEEGSKANAPFEVILVWKFSRFTRKRSTPWPSSRCSGARASAWFPSPKQATTTPPAGCLRESSRAWTNSTAKNLAQDVVQGMREAASRGFFLASNAPFGYRRVKVSDGVKERPTLEVDPATAPVVGEIFEKSLTGQRPQRDMQGN